MTETGRAPTQTLYDVLDAVERRGLPDVEVYCKRGRSRRVRTGKESSNAIMREEMGWAVRAGNGERSLHFAATGTPCPDVAWPQPRHGPLRLPAARPVSDWRAPSDLEASLIGEVEGYGLLEAVAGALQAEHPAAVLLRGIVEDGSSEVEIASTGGMAWVHRNRSAEIRLWAASRDGVQIHAVAAAREARRLSPKALARRLVDRLVVKERGDEITTRDRGEILIAPEVGAALLAAVAPLLLRGGPGEVGWEALEELADQSGRIGGRALTLVDDGRLSGGLFEAPVDGEGVPTREVVLLEEGVLRQPLLPFWEEGGPRRQTSGCRLRPGWRSLPETGPTHLYLRPTAGLAVATLLEEVARGYYFIDVVGSPRIDLPGRRLALPVSGFEVRGGRPMRPIRRAWLAGGLGPLLRSIQATARDLTFFPFAGAIGSPSVLLAGLEVRGEP